MDYPITIDNALPLHKFNNIRSHLEDGWKLSGGSNSQEEVPFWTNHHTVGTDLVYWDAGLYLKLILQKKLRVALEMKRFKGNLATAAMEGSSFHRDVGTPDHITAIVYGSPNWNVQWGGETVAFDGENYHYGTFIPNNCYVFPSHWEHYGAAPNVRALKPRITFAFMYKVCYNYPIANK